MRISNAKYSGCHHLGGRCALEEIHSTESFTLNNLSKNDLLHCKALALLTNTAIFIRIYS